MFFSAKNTLLFVGACSLVCLGEAQGERKGGVIRKYVMEGDRVVLPCSSGNGQSLEKSVVHWKNKDSKEVFFFKHGKHSANGQAGQDEQYRGRVSLFYDELKNGNASMILGDTKIEDTGNYTCVLPHVTPEGERSTMELIVVPVYKNRFGLKRGAVHAPVLGMSNVTDAGVELKCVVTGSSSEPSVEWQTCEGTALNATGQSVPDPRGRYDTKVYVTVTKTVSNCFRCVVKQADIYHVIDDEIIVPGKLFEKKSCDAVVLVGVWFSGVVTVVLLLAPFLIKWFLTRRSRQGQNDKKVENSRTKGKEEETEPGSSNNTSGHNVQNGGINTKTKMDETEGEKETFMSSYNSSGETDGDVVVNIPNSVSYKKSTNGSAKPKGSGESNL